MTLLITPTSLIGNLIMSHNISTSNQTIIKQLPKSIEKHLSENSSNVDVFNESVQTYNNALRKSNFTEKLIYETPTPKNSHDENKKRKRKRNILWFNPPYSKNVKTNVEKLF